MKNCLLILRTFIANKQIGLKYILIFFGIIFYSIAHGQTKTDAELYATWKDKSNSDGDRIKAYFDRLNVWEIFENGAKLDNKWFVASDKAIELALKLDKKEYLPLFYLASAFNYAMIQTDFARGCIEINKVIESAKVANASKFPVFIAYTISSSACQADIKEEDIINEFNKIKNGIGESCIKISNILDEINKEISYHSTKYFSSYRTLDLTEQITKLIHHNKIMNERILLINLV